MSISVAWDNPGKTRIHYDFNGLWTCDELRSAILQADALIAAANQPVSVIVDVQHSAVIPETAFLDCFRWEFLPSNSPDMLVVVGGCGLSNLLFFFFRQIYGRCRRFLVAETLERARLALAMEQSLAVERTAFRLLSC